jgi:hypothetical protein
VGLEGARRSGLKVETKFPARVDRDFIHRNDFISRHAIEQKAERHRELRVVSRPGRAIELRRLPQGRRHRR